MYYCSLCRKIVQLLIFAWADDFIHVACKEDLEHL